MFSCEQACFWSLEVFCVRAHAGQTRQCPSYVYTTCVLFLHMYKWMQCRARHIKGICNHEKKKIRNVFGKFSNIQIADFLRILNEVRIFLVYLYHLVCVCVSRTYRDEEDANNNLRAIVRMWWHVLGNNAAASAPRAHTAITRKNWVSLFFLFCSLFFSLGMYTVFYCILLYIFFLILFVVFHIIVFIYLRMSALVRCSKG